MSTDCEWLLELAERHNAELVACNYFDEIEFTAADAERAKSIAATLPPPYSPEPPTVEGWYWWRERAGAVEFTRKVIMERKRGRLMASDCDDWLCVEHPDVKGEWSGPIPQPPKGQE